MKKILIISTRNDPHAIIVSKALKKNGASPIIWHQDEFVLNQKIFQKISPSGEHTIKVNVHGIVDLQEIDVVWCRRLAPLQFPININPLDKEFVELENKIAMKSLWLTIGESSKWVNPFSSFDISNSKTFQLREAARIGMHIPETLITNDKAEISAFIEKNQMSGTIYKPYSSAIWEESNRTFSCYSSEISLKMLPDEHTISLTPGIYQSIIKKRYELRVVFLIRKALLSRLITLKHLIGEQLNRLTHCFHQQFSPKILKVNVFY